MGRSKPESWSRSQRSGTSRSTCKCELTLKGKKKGGDVKQSLEAGPNRDGFTREQVKNESEGSGEIAVSAGGGERLTVWEVRHSG